MDGDLGKPADVVLRKLPSGGGRLERMDLPFGSNQPGKQGRVVAYVHADVDHDPISFDQTEKGFRQRFLINPIAPDRLAHLFPSDNRELRTMEGRDDTQPPQLSLD